VTRQIEIKLAAPCAGIFPMIVSLPNGAEGQVVADRFRKRDLEFLAHKQENAGISFAEYYAHKLHRGISAGARHYSLGPNLRDDSWKVGEEKARYYFRAMSLKSGDRVIDYGCGSLRIGRHFIRFLEPGGYYGLDVISGFYEIGTQLVGEGLVREKQPRLAVISDDSIADAERFEADHVFSGAVCVHVHPDETQAYFRNLDRLVTKPGARLFFNAAVADEPMRFRYDSWAWPLSFYEKALAKLEFVGASVGNEHEKEGHRVRYANLEFRRQAAPCLRRSARTGVAGLGTVLGRLRWRRRA
jgi:hypothetical protein